MAALTKGKTVMTIGDSFGGRPAIVAGTAAGMDILALDADHLFNRPGNPYSGPDGKDWHDNFRRFAALSRAAADVALGALPGYRPDIVHAHDWQAGLTFAYMSFAAGPRPGMVMTIHNLAFQGQFSPTLFPFLGLPPEAFSANGIEYYGSMGYLKAGLYYADRITTVSPGYAAEIRTPEEGMGLDGLIRARSDVMSGIVNGIDAEIWNPKTDPHLGANYTKATMARPRGQQGRAPGPARPGPGRRRAVAGRRDAADLAKGYRPAAVQHPDRDRAGGPSWRCWVPANRGWSRASAPRSAPIRAGSAR